MVLGKLNLRVLVEVILLLSQYLLSILLWGVEVAEAVLETIRSSAEAVVVAAFFLDHSHCHPGKRTQ
jgi:hypothetical protein